MQVHDQLRQSQEALQQATQAQHRVRTTSALFLGVFAIIAGLIVIQVYLQARAWDRDASRAVAEVEAVATELKTLRDARSEARSTLPALLQEVGEQPLSFQEEGNAFSPRAQAIIDDIDDLAYVGQGRLVFQDLSSEPEAAVYLNGLLLSAVAHLNRSDPWTAFARLDQFFSQMTRFPDAVERRRIAQAYSYRALAGYMVLEAQDREPSWQRKTERAQLESLSKQAFADIAHAASVDPEWRHTTFVEALLCSRFYVPEETADNSSRSDLFVRGLRRAVSLYKGLIEERSYRGPSRRNLARCLKRIAEQTGEKSDFSDFGYGLNAFPTDEELADEALGGPPARFPGPVFMAMAVGRRGVVRQCRAPQPGRVPRLLDPHAGYQSPSQKLESRSGGATAHPAGDERVERPAAAIRSAHYLVQCHFAAPGAVRQPRIGSLMPVGNAGA